MAHKNQRDEMSLFRIPPYYFLHVLDQNTNVTRLEIGPKTFIRQDHERCRIAFFIISTLFIELHLELFMDQNVP